jgi:hypothetical protein
VIQHMEVRNRSKRTLGRTANALLETRPLRRMAPRVVVARRLRAKARYCSARSAPLYAGLLERSAQDVLRGGPCWAVLRGREQDPKGSAMALRFMGSIHRLVLDGRSPELARFYPSVGGGGGSANDRWEAFSATAEEHTPELRELVRRPVQTNEVGRCSALLGAFLLEAKRTGRPMRLLEVGASAGLNLRWDYYRYEAGERVWGDARSPVRIKWVLQGDRRPPLDVIPDILERRGCDLAPVDVTEPDGKLTLESYVWAEHVGRLRLLRSAYQVAARVPAVVDQADAVDWLEHELLAPRTGVDTVVFHSIVMQFLPSSERARMRRMLEQAGRRTTSDAPLTWVEMESRARLAEVALTSWPGGQREVVALASLYGNPVKWVA